MVTPIQAYFVTCRVDIVQGFHRWDNFSFDQKVLAPISKTKKEIEDIIGEDIAAMLRRDGWEVSNIRSNAQPYRVYGDWQIIGEDGSVEKISKNKTKKKRQKKADKQYCSCGGVVVVYHAGMGRTEDFVSHCMKCKKNAGIYDTEVLAREAFEKMNSVLEESI